MKRIGIIIILCLLLITPITSYAEKSNTNYQEKDEVIYVNLTEEGKQAEMFVVNTFDITKAGTYSDFGDYLEIKNLTNMEEITVNNNKVEFSAEEGKFHYQGSLEKALPWDIKITYYLNNKKVSPQSLKGKSGAVKMKIETRSDAAGNLSFYDHYVLQINATLQTNVFSRIKAEKGMIANAGEDKLVTFTVMPEEEGSYVLETNAKDFAFDGFEMNAVPSFIAIDAPDTGQMEGEMQTLQEAVNGIHDGASQLRNGLIRLADGTGELHEGSGKYKTGIDRLAKEVREANDDLVEAFSQFDNIFSEIEKIDFNEVDNSIGVIKDIPQELKEIKKEITNLQEEANNMQSELDDAITLLPDEALAKEDIDALLEADVDQTVIDELLAAYEAGIAVKSSYDQWNREIADDDPLASFISYLDEAIVLTDEISDTLGQTTALDDIPKEIDNIKKAYKTFQTGIDSLVGGIGLLSDEYGQIHQAIGEIKTGTNDSVTGATALTEGTSALKKGTESLPDKLKEEINAMLAQYDKSNFDMVSFVSEKNNHKIGMVQFTMKTASIKTMDEKEKAPDKEPEKSIWERVLALFSFFR